MVIHSCAVTVILLNWCRLSLGQQTVRVWRSYLHTVILISIGVVQLSYRFTVPAQWIIYLYCEWQKHLLKIYFWSKLIYIIIMLWCEKLFRFDFKGLKRIISGKSTVSQISESRKHRYTFAVTSLYLTSFMCKIYEPRFWRSPN